LAATLEKLRLFIVVGKIGFARERYLVLGVKNEVTFSGFLTKSNPINHMWKTLVGLMMVFVVTSFSLKANQQISQTQ